MAGAIEVPAWGETMGLAWILGEAWIFSSCGARCWSMAGAFVPGEGERFRMWDKEGPRWIFSEHINAHRLRQELEIHQFEVDFLRSAAGLAPGTHKVTGRSTLKPHQIWLSWAFVWMAGENLKTVDAGREYYTQMHIYDGR
jgi:hypothetical protein